MGVKTYKAIMLLLIFIYFSCSSRRSSFDKSYNLSKSQLLDSGEYYYQKNTTLSNTDRRNYRLLSKKFFEQGLDLRHAKSKILSDKEIKSILHLSDLYYIMSYSDPKDLFELYRIVGNKYKKNYILLDYLNNNLKPPHKKIEFSNLYRDSLHKLLYANAPYILLTEERKILESVYDRDQKFRRLLFGKDEVDSVRGKILLDSMEMADKRNYEIVDSMLTKRGWLGVKQIGKKASDAIFIVIHHSEEPETFFKFYNIIKKAYKRGDIPKSEYALYIDRYNVYKYGYQIYGTQSFYDKRLNKDALYPLKDTTRVNVMRKKMGLDPINF